MPWSTELSLLAERSNAELHKVNAWRLQEEATLRRVRIEQEPKEVGSMVERERRQSDWRLAALMRSYSVLEGRCVVTHPKGLALDVVPDYAVEIGADTLVVGTLARAGVSGFLVGN